MIRGNLVRIEGIDADAIGKIPEVQPWLEETEKDGKATFKDEDGDTKFEVTDEGTLKLKSKTTTELDALTGTAGEISFDSTLGVFKVWR